MDESQSIILSGKEARDRRLYIIWSHFLWYLGEGKTIGRRIRLVSAGIREWERRLTAKEHKKTFWGNENVLDLDDSYRTEYVSKTH